MSLDNTSPMSEKPAVNKFGYYRINQLPQDLIAKGKRQATLEISNFGQPHSQSGLPPFREMDDSHNLHSVQNALITHYAPRLPTLSGR